MIRSPLPSFTITVIPNDQDFDWWLRTSYADGGSVEIAKGHAFTYQACTHQAGRAIEAWIKRTMRAA